MNRNSLMALGFLASTQLLASPDDVVYGIDNRQDTIDINSSLYLELAESTAAMIPKIRLKPENGQVKISGELLHRVVPPEVTLPVCKKERFSDQPTASVCSGFLVGDDVLVTAGHCMTSQADCDENQWIFNYKVGAKDRSSVRVDGEDVYSCKQIIEMDLDSGTDFAVIKLDRKKPGKAVKIASNVPGVGTPLVMIGHPSGLPQKIADGARVTSLLEKGFHTDLDAFRGNSGSAVFNSNSGELLGILVNGNPDYVDNYDLNCSEVNVLPIESASEGVSSFLQFLPFIK